MVLPQAALPGPLELTKLKGKAIHVHISDCDGKVHGNLPPGRGVIKFEPYLQAIKELDINCTSLSSSNIRLTHRTSSNELRKPTQRLPV